MSTSQKKKQKKTTGFQSATDLFSKYTPKENKGYISREFQDFGYRLAVDLEDLEHKSLYMRMAKREERSVLEKALSFVSDANAKSKARLFMWKVKQLKEEKKQKKHLDKNTQEPGPVASLFDAVE